ncbi:TolC family protein [Novosphingobium sp. JCM 18896]|uniref:TolC family protein n=1 Tax=Novosphingobium sp. JCM 18896 TaxID=2989731 RepID=UPI002222A3B4|nr:TolC family protein [Novosphingobium sp. JCM 18896]MCW1431952.1 TolC family protein [Novosphingobium sp. JCM 18896]
MRTLALALPLLALPTTAALAGPLRFEEALARAEAQAPSLRAKALEADARRSALPAAGQLPDPKLGLGIDNFPVSGPPAGSFVEDSMTMARVGVSQEVPNAAKRHARTSRAQTDLQAAEATLLSESRRVKVATALAWIDLAYAERRLAALDGILSRLAPLPSAAKSGVAAGTARPAQTLQVRQSLAVLEDRRSELAAAVGRQRAILSRWTGEPAPEAVGDIPTLTVDATALQSGIANHPYLGAAHARVAQAEADVAIARADKRPDWAFDVAYQRRADRYGDMVSAGVTISLPLFAKRRQDPMIAASAASAAAALAEQEDMRRSLLADLEAGLADHAMHHEQWMRARNTLLPLARNRAELETASYAAGRAGLLDVIEAQTLLADSELQLLDREAEVARDAVRLVLTFGGNSQ